MTYTAKAPIMSNGTYAGNDTQGRLIPHGLNGIPKRVLIINEDGFHGVITDDELNKIKYLSQTAGGNITVYGGSTDATNIRVGHSSSYNNSMNLSGKTYCWIAWR